MSSLSVERVYVDSCSYAEKACAVLHLGGSIPFGAWLRVSCPVGRALPSNCNVL